MSLDKLFRHDGEPCFLFIRRSAWISMLFTLVFSCGFISVWFYGLWLVRTEFFDKIEALEKRLAACECVAKEDR